MLLETGPWGQIACSRVTMTIVLPQWNAMQQTQCITPPPLSQCRHRADMLLVLSLVWNITLKATTAYSMSLDWPDLETLLRPTQKAYFKPTLPKVMFRGLGWLTCKTGILLPCSCLIAPLCGYMNRHSVELRCTFQTLEGRSQIN